MRRGLGRRFGTFRRNGRAASVSGLSTSLSILTEDGVPVAIETGELLRTEGS